MIYNSTRNKNVSVDSCFAIANGISCEGGLYVPQTIPKVTYEWIESLVELPYYKRAQAVLKLFLTDFSDEELEKAVQAAYDCNNFDENMPALLKQVGDDLFCLELWHGPTCAFKDIALQILPRLMETAGKKALDGNKMLILVATSGDTGKAALEGFKDVDGISIAVFYPDDGVSPMQKLQMASQKGKNVVVYGIKGNFDDAQSRVKSIFTDKFICEELKAHNVVLSSANSINWGRLVPQIAYYFSAYADMLKGGAIKKHEKVNFSVPTGNFGNILAGYYAMRMGLPINKLLCASNKNNVLTDFINTGVYDADRKFFSTISPSMDILISSNLERLLYHLSDCDTVEKLMNNLADNKKYDVGQELKAKIDEIFHGEYLDDEDCKKVINRYQTSHSYLMDTHTAVAVGAWEMYSKSTGDKTKTIVVSTASPYKFAHDVLDALGEKTLENEFEAVEKLSYIAHTPVPKPILKLKNALVRFDRVILPEDMGTEVLNFAKGE